MFRLTEGNFRPGLRARSERSTSSSPSYRISELLTFTRTACTADIGASLGTLTESMRAIQECQDDPLFNGRCPRAHPVWHMHLSAPAIYVSTGIDLPCYRCPSMLNHPGSLKNAPARRERRLRTPQPSLSSHPLSTTQSPGRTLRKPGSLRICYRPPLTSHFNAQIPAPLR